MRTIGKTMQVLALLLLPISMAMQLTGTLGRSFHVSQMLVMLIFGSALFGIGRILETRK